MRVEETDTHPMSPLALKFKTLRFKTLQLKSHGFFQLTAHKSRREIARKLEKKAAIKEKIDHFSHLTAFLLLFIQGLL